MTCDQKEKLHSTRGRVICDCAPSAVNTVSSVNWYRPLWTTSRKIWSGSMLGVSLSSADGQTLLSLGVIMRVPAWIASESMPATGLLRSSGLTSPDAQHWSMYWWIFFNADTDVRKVILSCPTKVTACLTRCALCVGNLADGFYGWVKSTVKGNSDRLAWNVRDRRQRERCNQPLYIKHDFFFGLSPN